MPAPTLDLPAVQTAKPAETAPAPSAAPLPIVPPAVIAGQVTPALLTLAQGQEGTQQMTLRLHPVELGTVQVHIERDAQGAAQITVTAERPATLQALTQEAAQLHRGLDNAGIPASGRTISFALAAEAAPALSAHAQATGAHDGGDSARRDPDPAQEGMQQNAQQDAPPSQGQHSPKQQSGQEAPSRTPAPDNAESFNDSLETVA